MPSKSRETKSGKGSKKKKGKDSEKHQELGEKESNRKVTRGQKASLLETDVSGMKTRKTTSRKLSRTRTKSKSSTQRSERETESRGKTKKKGKRKSIAKMDDMVEDIDNLLIEDVEEDAEADIETPAEKPRKKSIYESGEGKIIQSSSVKFCRKVIADLWGQACDISSERLIQSNAPLVVSLELRDTWLRVLEAEWLDQDQPREEVVTADLFVADVPPLPLALDSWSKGALELFPNSRRESVMDPFLRKSAPDDGGGEGEGTPSTDTSELPLKTIVKEKITLKSLSISQKKKEVKPSAKSPRSGRRKSSLEKDEEKKGSKKSGRVKYKSPVFRRKKKKAIQKSPKPSESTDDRMKYLSCQTYARGEDEEEDFEGECFDEGMNLRNILYSPPPPPPIIEDLDDWIVHIPSQKISSEHLSPSNSEEYRALGLRPWSPSQCGGRTGSGVFKLFDETSSQAVRKPRKPKKVRLGGGNQVKVEVDENVDDDDKEIEVKTVFSRSTPAPKGLLMNEYGGEEEEQHWLGETSDFGVWQAPNFQQDHEEVQESEEGEVETDHEYGEVLLPMPNFKKHRTPSADTLDETMAFHHYFPSAKKPVNVIDRIDNLEHADSDEVIHLLTPAEAPKKNGPDHHDYIPRLSTKEEPSTPLETEIKEIKDQDHKFRKASAKSGNANARQTNANPIQSKESKPNKRIMKRIKFKKKEADADMTMVGTTSAVSAEKVVKTNCTQEDEEKEESIRGLKKSELIKRQRNALKARLLKKTEVGTSK